MIGRGLKIPSKQVGHMIKNRVPLLVGLALFCSTLIGCQKGSDSAIAQYTCPMHPEVVQDQPGKCPKCQMDLVPKK